MKTLKKHLLVVFIAGAVLSSCKKNDDSANLDSPPEKHLTIGSGDEFRELMNTVPRMTQAEFTQFKQQHGGYSSLYDKFKRVKMELEKAEDSAEIKRILAENTEHFYADENGFLEVKAGVTISRLLNENGVLEIGGGINRFTNGRYFYTPSSNTKEKQILLTSKDLKEILSRGKQPVPTEDIPGKANQQNKSNTIIKEGVEAEDERYNSNQLASIKHIGFPSSGIYWTQYWYYFTGRHENGRRRFFVSLVYEFNAIQDGHGLWSYTESVFLKFGHHKKVLFTWNTYSQPTVITSLYYRDTYYTSRVTLGTPINRPEVQDDYFYFRPNPTGPNTTITSVYVDSPSFYEFHIEANDYEVWMSRDFSGDTSGGPVQL